MDKYLIHHGVKGQKYGVRRWQNKDGSLTPEGYIHYGYGKNKSRSDRNEIASSHNRSKKTFNTNKKTVEKHDRNKRVGSAKIPNSNKQTTETSSKSFSLTDEQKKNLKIALGLTAAAAVAGGTIYYAKHKSDLNNRLITNKKLTDFTMKEGDLFQTLSYDSERVNKGDMFYASHTVKDNNMYRTYYATDFKKILAGEKPPLKYEIKSRVVKDMNVASEKSASKAFSSLYRTNDDFRDFVTDPKKMREYYTTRVPKQFSGYKEALKALDRVSGSNNPSDSDLELVYRLFNYTIPHEESSKVRGMFFSELKKNGYGALLDTNDALYGGFHSNSPVIIFDMESVVKDSVKQLKLIDVSLSAIELGKEKLSFIDTDVVYK